MATKSILITGGCGFVGSNLALAFARRGDAVTALDNLSRHGSDLLRQRIEAHGVRFVRGDIRNTEDLQAFGSHDVMIECSAEPSVLAGTQGDDAAYVVSNNLGGALNCFEWARATETPVIFLSSSRVYPYDRINALPFDEQETRFELRGCGTGYGPDGLDPDFPMAGARSLYGATKWAAEIMLQEYAQQYDLPACINRCGVIAGPWQLGKVDQGVFTYWLVRHMARRSLSYIGFGGAGKQVRDLLHIDDLAELVLLQADRISTFRGDCFQAAGSSLAHLSLQETTALCRKLTGQEIAMGADPLSRPADVRWLKLDNRRTTECLGWEPRRDAATILRDIHAWLQEYPDYLQMLAGGA
jgi:CDP-paratose 2-epimerase